MPNTAARVLLRFSRIVVEANGREILPLLAHAAIEHVGADGAAVVEVLAEGRVKVAASEGLPSAMAEWSTEAETIGFELGEELKAACGGRFAEAHVRPMMSGGGLFGALVLLFLAERRPSPEQLELADGLVDLAATTLSQIARMDELRRAHAELRASQDTLVRTERLRALGEMAAGINHDLKNILNPISLHMQLLSRAVDRGDLAKSREIIAEVGQIVRHGSELLETLRRFSRQAPETALETVDLDQLAHEAIEMAKPRVSTSGGGIEIREAFASPPPVAARSSEIVSALLNIIVNAVDAMERGGTIIVRTREERGGALVEVADNGPGMAPDVASRVFEPFFTTKGHAGTGLGLAMVRACAERYGGSVSLNTAPGVGTTIGLWFPPATSAPPVAVSSSRAPEAARLLIVEDDPLSRAATRELLTEEGYEVTDVATGGAALGALGAGHPFDLVVTDLGLPDIGGAELVRRIREVTPGLSVIALTGRSRDDSDVSKLLGETKVAFMQKPFDIDLLVQKIEGLLRPE